MEILSAADLRNVLRARLFVLGLRGFVRIAPPGGELLVTDAFRHTGDLDGWDSSSFEEEKGQLRSVGFVVKKEHGLVYCSPDEGWLDRLQGDWGRMLTSFQSCRQVELLVARSLAERLLRCDPVKKPSEAGRQLILEALRLPNPEPAGWSAVDALRPQIATMLRQHDRSGMRETGMLLAARIASSRDTGKRRENAPQRSV
ncbi:MAG: hypothetical protein K5746_08425 [Clostridiales bacterium]|nr:hypothetical protein [Clostridiales bacterium]